MFICMEIASLPALTPLLILISEIKISTAIAVDIRRHDAQIGWTGKGSITKKSILWQKVHSLDIS